MRTLQGHRSLADLVAQRKAEHERQQRTQSRARSSKRYQRWHVPETPEREPENWLMTYLDLVTLLLALLVVMLAFTRLNASAEPAASRAAPVLATGLTLTKTPAGPLLALPQDLPTIPAAWAHNAIPQTAHERMSAGAELPATTPVKDGAPAALPALESITTLAANDAAAIAETAKTLAATYEATATTALPAATDEMTVTTAARAPTDEAAMKKAVPAPTDEAAMKKAVPAPTDEATMKKAVPAPTDEATVKKAVPAPTDVASPTGTTAPQTMAAGTSAAPTPPALAATPTAEELGLAELGDAVDVIINSQSVSFRISNELLFPSGQAMLSPSGLLIIRKLAEVINRSPHPVSVEGHSDPVPIQNKQFPSNWELSSSRATAVLRELVRDGVAAHRLRAVGYADTRPLQDNDTAPGRAANRRVELIMRIVAEATPAQTGD